MSYDEDIIEIERLEREMRGEWVDPPAPDSRLFKVSARVALLERWFDGVAEAVPPPADLAKQARLRVRTALRQVSAGNRSGGSPPLVSARSWKQAGWVAVAAGFLLLMTAPLGRIIEQGFDRRVTFGAYDALMASFRVALDDEDRALMDVEQDLDALEDRVYALPTRSTEDAMLREVDEEMDRMFHDLDTDFDT